MAKINADVQLSPAKSVKDKDEGEDDNDETFVNLLNSHGKSRSRRKSREDPPESSRKTGSIAQRLLSLVGFPAQQEIDGEQISSTSSKNGEATKMAPTEDEFIQAAIASTAGESVVGDAPLDVPKHTTITNGNTTNHPPTPILSDDLEENTVPSTNVQLNATTTTPSTPTAHSSSDTRKRLSAPKVRPGDLAKRRRHPQSRDIYAVPAGETPDGEIQRPAKHFKVSKKKEAQQPLVIPKRTLTSAQDSLFIDDTPVEPPGAKRRRGRPRKTPVQPANAEVSESGDDRVNEGVEPILLQPTTQNKPTFSRELPLKMPTEWNPPDDSQPESEPEPVVNSSISMRHSERPAPTSSLPDIKALGEMLSTLENVGHTYNKKRDKWISLKSVAIASTMEGERVERRLGELATAYNNIRAFRNTGKTVNNAQSEVTTLVNAVKDESNQILTARLGRPLLGIDYFDSESTEKILTDLYFVLIPKFVRTIKLGLEVYAGLDGITLSALHELGELLDLLYELIDTALDQPKDSQPNASGKVTYQTIRPIRGILPTLRDLRSRVWTEIKTRKRRQDLSESRNRSVELHGFRVEEEEMEEAQRRSRNEEILKLQKEDLARKFADPVWGRVKQKELEKAMAKEAARPFGVESYKYGANTSRPRSSTQDGGSNSQIADKDDVNGHPFADDGFERLTMFGKHNTHKGQARNPISKKDKESFVLIMCTERGDDRYEKAANKLERSIEEIFELAKDLQDAMDVEHENGRMNEPEHDWTYDVWVEQQ